MDGVDTQCLDLDLDFEPPSQSMFCPIHMETEPERPPAFSTFCIRTSVPNLAQPVDTLGGESQRQDSMLLGCLLFFRGDAESLGNHST